MFPSVEAGKPCPMLSSCFQSILVALAMGLLLASAPAQARGRHTPQPAVFAPLLFDGGALGSVAVSLPQAGKANELVILFVDAPENPSARQAVAQLTALGSAVATIDTHAYMAALIRRATISTDCLWLSSDVEELNLQVQRKLGFPQFRLPILASSGQGGVLVYALLAEAPSYSYAGGVSLDFAPRASPLNFCDVGPSSDENDWLPKAELNLPWQVEPGTVRHDEIADWINDLDKAELLQPVPGLSGPQHVAALVRPMINAAITQDASNLEDLPLIEMPSTHSARYLAIVYSGDGGWRDLDRTLGGILQQDGVPVVGVDSLLYFWQPKRPEIVAHDLDRVAQHYRRAWHIDNVILVGFSFGADILPFAYNLMSPEEKMSVKEISLLALSRNTRFEISVSGFISDAATSQTRLVAPELGRIAPSLVQCFYGEEEAADSACTTPQAAGTELIETSGGHHFDEDYDDLARRIMDGAARRTR